jgi:hypothetical protein
MGKRLTYEAKWRQTWRWMRRRKEQGGPTLTVLTRDLANASIALHRELDYCVWMSERPCRWGREPLVRERAVMD